MSDDRSERQTMLRFLSRGLIYSAPLMMVAAYGISPAVATTGEATTPSYSMEHSEVLTVAEGESEGEDEGEGEGEGEGEAEG